MSESWQDKIKAYCDKYNILINYLAETLQEPKVIPMIRGKAFEFSVMVALQEILPENKWDVSKPFMNAQTGFHDIDVNVTHKPTGKSIRIECKLVKKESFRSFSDGHSEIRVKCMRSRTLGTSKVKELAPKLGVERKVLTIHNDQYLPQDFDIVISSIGNAFYRTDKKTGLFEWKPSTTEIEFLKKFNPSSQNNLKDFAFHKMFVAKTKDLAIGHASRVICTRGKCRKKKSCGFIPNYPIIRFDSKLNKPTNGWIPIEDFLNLFESFINK